MNLIKKSSINLTKGSTISLQKKGKVLTKVMMGINWGSIRHQLFGITYNTEAVDLDSSVAMIGNKKLVDHVYYRQLKSAEGAVRHSGDDRIGDRGGDDGSDNETIHVDLSRINPEVDQIVFYLNSYRQQDFETIPYAKIRIVDASDATNLEELAQYNVAIDKTFRGHVSMVLGKIVRTNAGWDFKSLGDPIKARNINECLRDICAEFV